MLKLSPISISLLALTIAVPVLAADLPGTAAHPAPAAPTKPAPVVQTTVAPKAGMVDINTATAADLKGASRHDRRRCGEDRAGPPLQGSEPI